MEADHHISGLTNFERRPQHGESWRDCSEGKKPHSPSPSNFFKHYDPPAREVSSESLPLFFPQSCRPSPDVPFPHLNALNQFYFYLVTMASPAFAAPVLLATLGARSAFATSVRPLTSVARPTRALLRMQYDASGSSENENPGDGGAEEEAPSDSFVETGTAVAGAAADAVGSMGTRGPAMTELLSLAAATGRGKYATHAQKSRVEGLVATLEEANPTEGPVETDMIDGEWSLVYASGMGEASAQKRFVGVLARPAIDVRQVRQTLAVDEGRLENEVDVVLFPDVSIVVKTAARLTPVGGERLEVGVEKTTVTGGSLGGRFDLGGISFDVPVEQIYSRIKGTAPETVIDTTYLDETLRISKSKSKLFVYARV